MKGSVIVTLVAVVLGFSTLAHAALVDNGGGLIYDTDRNITWYDYTPSKGSWSGQMFWAEHLSVTDINGKSITGWRLPTALNQDGTFTYKMWNDIGSEMGHLYYTELGNKAYYNVVDGTYRQPGTYGLVNKGPFTNLQATTYWSGTELAPGHSHSWFFNFEWGLQDGDDGGAVAWYALAVHEGNVGASAPVPIPPTVYLLGAGLFGVGFVRKKFRK